MMERIWNLGVLGCGNISDIYVTNIQKYFKNISIVSCAARHLENAEKLAKKFNIPKAYTTEEMLADEEVEVILNLTVPQVHFPLNKEILKAEKHVYSEKPLAGSCEEIEELQKLAEQHGKRVGCAPDTWLGTSIQTCMELIRRGEIGEVISVTANLMNHGVETWHPSPAAYYQKCGGPILDMGPYYITAMVALLGSVKQVMAFGRKGRTERTIYSSPLQGERIPVEVNTSYCGILKFQSGVIGNINMSFDVWQSDLPMLEIYGTEGKIKVPDPNWFDGEIEVIKEKTILNEIKGRENTEKINRINTIKEWYPKEDLEKVYQSPSNNLRGIGVWDMLYCIDHDKQHKNNLELVLHVTEVLTKLNEGEDNRDPYIHHQVSSAESIVSQIAEGGIL